MDINWPIIVRGSPEFRKLLLRELGPRECHDLAVMDSVLANALDKNHKEQALWMKRYEAMRGHDFLWPDEGG